LGATRRQNGRRGERVVGEYFIRLRSIERFWSARIDDGGKKAAE